MRVSSTPPDVDPNYYAQFGRDECRRACHKALANKMHSSVNISRMRTLCDLLVHKFNPEGAVFSLSEAGNNVQLRYEGAADGGKFSSSVQELYERKQIVYAVLPGGVSKGFFVVGTTDEAHVKELVGQEYAAAQRALKSVRLQTSRRLMAGVGVLARTRTNGSLSPRGQ